MPDPQTDSGATEATGMPGGVSLDSLVKGAMSTPSGAPFVAANKRLDEIERNREKELDPLRKKLGDEAERTLKDEEDAFRRIEPLNLPKQPDQRDFQTDTLQSFGSMGMIFAQIASAFTHQPMINALNAGAASMNAIKANDAEAYKTAYEAWKDNTQLALDRHKMAHEEFEDIVAMHKDNLSALDAALQVHGAKYSDQIAMESVKNGNIDHLFQAEEARQRAYMGMLDAMPKIQEVGMINWSVFDKDQQWLDTPDGQAWRAKNPKVKGAPPQIHMQHYMDAVRGMTEAKSPYGRGMSLSAEEAKGVEQLVRSGVSYEDAIRRIVGSAKSGTTDAKTAAAAKTNKELSDEIGQLIDDVNADPSIVGTRGMVGRGIEAVEGFLDPKAVMDTPAQRFQSKMTEMREKVSANLTGSKYYSARRASDMARIMPGLESMTSPQQTINALQQLKSQLDGAADENPDAGGPSAAPPGGATTDYSHLWTK